MSDLKGFDHPETTRTWDALYYGDSLSTRYYDEAIRRVVARLGPQPGERILDAGCGAGVHAIRVARAGWDVDAIDFSPSALKDAARRAAEAGVLNRIRFQHGDLTRLSIPDGAYRRIFSWGVLIHIPEVEAAMNELVRILADGGRLALYVSNLQGLQFNAGRLKRRFRGRLGDLQRMPMGWSTRADLHGESIWVWFNDIDAMVRHMEARGLRLIPRETGQFSDLHLRYQGVLRRFFVRLNHLWLSGGFSPRWAYMNLLIFEKGRAA